MKTNVKKTLSRNAQPARKKLTLGSKKPFESRADWSIAYPTAKRADWQSDFGGVTRLTATGLLYCINPWKRPGSLTEPPGFKLSIKAKHTDGKAVSCQLWTDADHPERYQGRLQLNDEVGYRVTLWPDNEPPRYLSIHFELEGDTQ